ncbi:MAG TPA: OmpA family protein, partial [Devosia sp.]|nr:OmpA family protein [Devosia sp.]
DARDGTLSGTTTDPASVQGLIDSISSLHGVRSITSDVSVAPTASPYDFKAEIVDGKIALSGAVPSLSMRDQLLDVTGGSDAGLELKTGVPTDDWLGVTSFAVSRLDGLESGQASLADLALSVSGTAKTPQSYVRVRDALAADLPLGLTLAAADIAPATVEDYTFSAARTADGYQLSGFIPDEATRQHVAELTGADASPLLIARGAPDAFGASLDYGLGALAHMSNGTMQIEGADLTLSGTATSQLDYAALKAMGNSVPEGVNARFAQLDPATADPYFWSVQKRADGSLTLRGYVPGDNDRALVLAEAGDNAIDHMQIAAGAPADFQSDSLAAIAALKNLETGRAGFSGDTWFIEGQPATRAALDATHKALSAAGTAVSSWRFALADVPQHPVPAFRWSAEKFSNGTVILNGNVPDEATRAALKARAGDRVTDLMTIGTNAPEHFYEDALVAISAVKELSHGRAGFSTDGWFLNGLPATKQALETASLDLITARTPKERWHIALADVPQHPVPAFRWSVEKFDNGTVVLEGGVPDESTRIALNARAGDKVTDLMILAPNRPEHFYEDALVAISAVKELAHGRAGFSTDGWFLNGTPAPGMTREGATNALITARTPADKWHIAVTDTPLVPYVWTARKGSDGRITLSGHVPDEATRNALNARAGDGSVDQMQIAFGAPDHFYEDALVAISALKELQTGRAGVAGGGWYLAGTPASASARDAATGALITARTPADQWSIAVAAAPEPAAPGAPETDEGATTLSLNEETAQEASQAATEAPVAEASGPAVEPVAACRAVLDAFNRDITINFASASSSMDRESLDALRNLATWLQKCPDSRVDIAGHTDSQGDFAANLRLSIQRADSVATALAKFGVEPSRLKSVGYGESQPIASNDTEEGRRANRRIVLSIPE